MLLALYKSGCMMHPLTMHTYSTIVRAAGKPEKLALALGVSIHTVRSWIQRGSVPKNQWPAFVNKGWATFDELLQAEMRSAQDRAA